MSDTLNDLFAPQGGWRVRILDLSGASADNVVEEIAGFPTLMRANAFARRRAAGGSASSTSPAPPRTTSSRRSPGSPR